MATTAPKRQERLEVRVTSEVKELIEYAANLRGETITAFATRVLAHEAEEAIARHQVIKLSMEHSRAFVTALLEESEPNEYFLQAIEDYQKLVSEDDIG